MQKLFLCSVSLCCFLAGLTSSARGQQFTSSSLRFSYQDSTGRMNSAPVMHRYWNTPITHPIAAIDPDLDPKLRRAASIAEERANARSKARCWRYVKQALVASGAIDTYPRSNYAYQAGAELVRDYGFRKLAVRDQYDAPLGSVLVFGDGSQGAGHVELRTRDGFVSDYRTSNRCRYPLTGVYGKSS